MSLVNQPNILSGEFAAEGDKNTIPANNDGLSGLASIAKGFPPITQQPLAQGGLPPQRQDFNGIFNLISKYLLYAQVGGVYEYNNTLDYQPPCIISYNDKFYACKEANGPSTSAGIQSPTVADYWDEVIIEVATEAEAEAQSEQNNSKIMTPLRVYQAIVAYFTKFLAAAVFTGIVKAVAPAAASNDNSVPTTSWVRTCFESMAKTVAEILEIQWKAEATGYLLLGPYLGNLKILWGRYSIQEGNWYVDVITALNLTDYFIALSVDSINATASLGQYTIQQMCWNTEPSTTNTIRFLWEKEVVAEDGAVYVAIGK